MIEFSDSELVQLYSVKRLTAECMHKEETGKVIDIFLTKKKFYYTQKNLKYCTIIE